MTFRESLKWLVLSLLFCSNSLLAQGGSDFTEPKEYIIDEVNITGSQFTDKNAIRQLCGIFPGDKIVLPGEKTTEAIQSLWRGNLFDHVEILGAKLNDSLVAIEIRVIEKPRL